MALEKRDLLMLQASKVLKLFVIAHLSVDSHLLDYYENLVCTDLEMEIAY